jgi:hypothetical protein
VVARFTNTFDGELLFGVEIWSEPLVIFTIAFDGCMVGDKVPSGDDIMVPLKSPLVSVPSTGTKLAVIDTITCDGCMAEDMLPSGNEVMVLLGLTFNVEVTEVTFRVPLYGALSLSVQSNVPQPSMVEFLTNRKG